MTLEQQLVAFCEQNGLDHISLNVTHRTGGEWMLYTHAQRQCGDVRVCGSSGYDTETFEAALPEALANLATKSGQLAPIEGLAAQQTRPSVLFRPALSTDGTMWCALFGDNLQEGVAGFGETPDAAMRAFDKAWMNERTPKANISSPGDSQ